MSEPAKKQWILSTGRDIAQALEWVRRRSLGKTLLLVAIGRNGIAYAKHGDVSPAEAIQFLEDELHNLKQGLQQIDDGRTCFGSRARREY